MPRAAAKPLSVDEKKPVVVSVDAQGNLYLNEADDPKKPIDATDLMARVAAVLRHKPGRPVVVKGDRSVPYGRVVLAMTLLQRAGVPSVGLATQHPEAKK